MKSIIPQMSGFMLPLSPYEIVSDIGEIQKKNTAKGAEIDPSIIESDNQSVESEDILESFYPVQPRYHPIEPSGELTAHAHSSKRKKTGIESIKVAVDMKSVDVGESVSFLREVQKSFKDLHDTEHAREQLETLAKAYSSLLEKECSKYVEQRPAEENYVRLLQGLYIRNIRQHAAQSKQLSMLCHSYVALKKKREAEEELTTHCKQLQAILGHSSHTQHDIQAALSADAKQQLQNSLNKGVVKVLRVQEANTTNEIVLFDGQYLRTPMGQGKVVALNPVDKKVTIQLAFGVMYSSLSTVIVWSKMEKDRFDCTSEGSLLQHWDTLKTEYTSSFRDRAVMKEILEGASTSLATIGAEELEAFIPTAPEKAKMDTDDASAEESTLDTNPPTFYQHSDHNNGSSSKKAALDNNVAAKSSSSSSSSACRTRAAASHSDFDRAIGRVFPLTLKDRPAADSSVKKVEKFIRRTYKAQESSVSSQTLPMAFMHPASLAVTLQKPPAVVLRGPFQVSGKPALQSTSVLDGNAHKRRIKVVCYDVSALTDSFNPNTNMNTNTASLSSMYPPYPPPQNHSFGFESSSNRTGDGDSEERDEEVDPVGVEEWTGARLGSSASLTWTGDIIFMRKTLQGIEDKVQQLEQEKAYKQKMIERFRMEEAKICSETTALRLATFTRRIMHRNHLSNHGIVIQAPITPAAPVAKMGLRGSNNATTASSSIGSNGAANIPQKIGLGYQQQQLAALDAVTITTGKPKSRATGVVADGSIIFQKPEVAVGSSARVVAGMGGHNEPSLASSSTALQNHHHHHHSNSNSSGGGGGGGSNSDIVGAENCLINISMNERSQRGSASKNSRSNRSRNRHTAADHFGQGAEESTTMEQEESDAGTEDNASFVAAAVDSQTLLGKRKSIETKKDGDVKSPRDEEDSSLPSGGSSGSGGSSSIPTGGSVPASSSKQPLKKNRKS